MKINFDTIASYDSIKPTKEFSSPNPIKVAVESPIYNQVVKQISPHNFKSQITSMNKIINLPIEVSRFIEEQIEKQINQNQNSFKLKKVQIVDIQYKQTNKQQGPPNNFNKQILSKKINQMKKIQKKKTNKIGWVYNYKKHSCQSSVCLPTEVRNTLKQIRQFTGTPTLYTSNVNRKMSNGRVYNNLYSDANKRKYKAQMNKIAQQKKIPQAKPKINASYFKMSKTAYVSLFSRLDQILQNRQDKRKSKLCIDEQTGRQLFKLDLNSSRSSYKIYFQSLSKQKITTKKKNSLQLNKTKNIEQDKTLNLKIKKLRQNKIDTKTIQHFTQIFYPRQNQSIQLNTSTTSNSIKKPQFLILHQFLHQIQQLQSRKYEMQTTVSSKLSNSAVALQKVLSKQQFQSKFKTYYQGLSLHDRQILRKQIVKKKRQEFNNQSHGFQPQSTFKPVINIRSASLDNLAGGHQKHIYYV